ncbi:hypothetical protein [Dactylosporangium sp. NPDC051484]|uniref:hypothetical protein n=1 Tax=Dactylosporangium sp. NPDC051484 TaxID=3154942 RepID=UPI003450D8E0
MKEIVATVVVALGAAAGVAAVASPAWAACGLGADNPTSSNQSWGSRTGCSGTVTLEVRFAKDVFGPDPYLFYRQANFSNGDLGVQGDCRNGQLQRQ